MRPIVEALGLDWEGQRQRIQRDDVLSTAFIMQAVDGVAADNKNREMLAIPAGHLGA
jgi:hypothetical protein